MYFFLVVVLRLAGKRELAQLNPFDLVVLLTLSNTVQNAIIGNDNSLAGGMSAGQLVMIPLASVLTISFGWRTSYLWPGSARLALTGRGASPPIFDVAVVLGKERSLDRLDRFIEAIPRLAVS